MKNRLRTVIFIQPRFPHYRESFFRRLFDDERISGILYFSPMTPEVNSGQEQIYQWAKTIGSIWSLPLGLGWQSGALAVPIRCEDILVISGNPRLLSNLVVAVKGKLRGATIIWWSHYWSANSKSWRFSLRLLLMRMADALMFYTDEEVTHYHEKTRRKDSRVIFALNNGIELEPVRAARSLRYRLSQRPRDLLFIGRITSKSQLELLIEALAQPSADFTLDVIGDGPEAANSRLLAKRLGVADRIVWHGESTDEALIATVANSCKVFVYPGAVGLSLIHGLAYGLPAIVHDNRWKHMPEIAALRPGVNGATFRYGDVTSLAEVIRGILDRPDGLERMSKEALNTTEKSFNTADMASRFVSALTSLEPNLKLR